MDISNIMSGVSLGQIFYYHLCSSICTNIILGLLLLFKLREKIRLV
jgi:hypothetical protein